MLLTAEACGNPSDVISLVLSNLANVFEMVDITSAAAVSALKWTGFGKNRGVTSVSYVFKWQENNIAFM